ncbi:MAG: hypothetical protein LRY69_04095 [Gammaproteobacteria bacterium]|nr:hypothetical protein [Gammaproteobacteria bacterium]
MKNELLESFEFQDIPIDHYFREMRKYGNIPFMPIFSWQALTFKEYRISKETLFKVIDVDDLIEDYDFILSISELPEKLKISIKFNSVIIPYYKVAALQHIFYEKAMSFLNLT